jgi:hypothetical protein
MKKFTVIASAAALALAAVLPSVTAAQSPRAELEEAMSHDGLEKIKVKGIDLAYSRPGATLAGYNKLIIDPVEVAFRKDWDPNRTGSRMKVDAKDRENIRSGVAKVVQEEFAKEIGKGGTYQIVTEAGPDVLRLRASIADLYVNAPDTMSPGRTRTYTVSAGEMTLVAGDLACHRPPRVAGHRHDDPHEQRGEPPGSGHHRLLVGAHPAQAARRRARHRPQVRSVAGGGAQNLKLTPIPGPLVTMSYLKTSVPLPSS